MRVTIAPITPDQFDTLLQAFNEGYEGYIVPVHLEAAQLQGHIDNNSIDLSASRLAFADDAAVGMALLGIRGERAWVGGVGVSPAWRGQGVGRRLMEGVIEAARERGLKTVQLEVIQGNSHAHNLYLSLGFENLRRLLIIERPAQADRGLSATNLYNVQPVLAEAALAHYAALHPIPNCWQREAESLRPSLATMQGWKAEQNGATAAYALGYSDKKAIQWMDMGVQAGEAESLRDLIGHVHADYPEVVGRLVNLGEDDPAWLVLSSLGYVEKMAQYEMRLELKPV